VTKHRRSRVGSKEFEGGIALLSPSGWGNLGDAAIVDSVIHAAHARLPGAPLLALTLNPNDSMARHGIPALTLTGFSRPHYGVAENGPALTNAAQVDEQLPAANQNWRTKYGRAFALPRALVSVARAVPSEARHRQRLSGPTGRLRLVIVAGGGQIDDFWGGAFGHPYVLWRWAQHARWTGAKFVILSVGTGCLTSPMARLFARRALSLASYRSFRDEGSRSLLKIDLVARDPIVPDLAYAYPVEQFQPFASFTRDRPLIGISPIAYGDARNWPIADEARYRDYLKRLASFAARLVRSGHDLLLFGTDSPDLLTVQDLKAEIATQVSAAELARVSVPNVRSVAQLYAALSGAHFVVASRLHGVLLTQLAGVPVLALSYERKVQTHMRSLGQERFCLGIDDFDAPTALSRLTEMAEQRTQLSESILRSTAERRSAVELQYDEVLGPRLASAPAAVASRLRFNAGNGIAGIP
jgi:polysaccharide pyruvyl transferase WcaK-like protein